MSYLPTNLIDKTALRLDLISARQEALAEEPIYQRYRVQINQDSLYVAEMARQALYDKYGEDVYYFKSNQTGIDIDFYLPEEKCAIQVSYNIDSAEDRETKSLISFAEKTEEKHRLIIVTNEEERTITKDGVTIEVIPAFKFILGKEKQKNKMRKKVRRTE